MNNIFTSIRRTPYQSFASFLILFFTLFLSASIFMTLMFVHGLLSYVETLPQITVYFQKKIPEEDVMKVRNDLMKSGKISSVKYVSKEEAYKIFKDLNKDKPLLLEMISANTLPASIEIKANKPEYLKEIYEFSKKQSGVDEVRFEEDTSKRLINLTNILRKTSLALFAYLIFMSIMVLSTITLFKIALKKDEIELLKLLGASNFYIKKPYLGEGVFFGLMAGICSFAIIVGTLLYLNPLLKSYMQGITKLIVPLPNITVTVWPLNGEFLGLTFVLLIVFGMGIAFIANFIATEKYLS